MHLKNGWLVVSLALVPQLLFAEVGGHEFRAQEGGANDPIAIKPSEAIVRGQNVSGVDAVKATFLEKVKAFLDARRAQEEELWKESASNDTIDEKSSGRDKAKRALLDFFATVPVARQAELRALFFEQEKKAIDGQLVYVRSMKNTEPEAGKDREYSASSLLTWESSLSHQSSRNTFDSNRNGSLANYLGVGKEPPAAAPSYKKLPSYNPKAYYPTGTPTPAATPPPPPKPLQTQGIGIGTTDDQRLKSYIKAREESGSGTP
ncbi:hypothetical protein K2X33_15925 [bacterium]|nr:hypothetical protein [bacterium]